MFFGSSLSNYLKFCGQLVLLSVTISNPLEGHINYDISLTSNVECWFNVWIIDFLRRLFDVHLVMS